MLSSHDGAYDSCLRLIEAFGHSLSVQGEADEQGRPIASELVWIARMGEYEFRAANPIELLGLCALHAHIRPQGPPTRHWWNIPGEPLIARLVSEAFPESGGRFG